MAVKTLTDVTKISAIVNAAGWKLAGQNKSGSLVYVVPGPNAKLSKPFIGLLVAQSGGLALEVGYLKAVLKAVASGDSAKALAAHDAHCEHERKPTDAKFARFTTPDAKTWGMMRNRKRTFPFVIPFVDGTQPRSKRNATTADASTVNELLELAD
jgi:hypothetical protein